MNPQFDKLMDVINEAGMDAFDSFLIYDMKNIQRMIANGTPVRDINNPFLSFVGDIELLDSYGGEGDGDSYWKVFRIGGHVYRMDAFYSSWDGRNYDTAEIYEVEPREVVVIEYYRKK